MELCPKVPIRQETVGSRSGEDYFWIWKQKRPGEPGRLRFQQMEHGKRGSELLIKSPWD
jgi:hypothetical protein